MRFRSLPILAFSLALPLGWAPAQDPAVKKMRDPATNEQLIQSLRMAQQKDPIRDLGPAIGKSEEDPSKTLAGRDLIKDSIILCFRGELTLVPKRAVLHLPGSLKDRFEARDKVKVVSWKDFYQKNRGWLRTVEVTREQAMGQVPLAEETVASFEGLNAAVVATFKGGPISVLPYVAPETEGSPGGASPDETGSPTKGTPAKSLPGTNPPAIKAN